MATRWTALWACTALVITCHFASTDAQCSRRLSRQAVKLIEDRVLPVVDREGIVLPAECPLHVERNRFLFQEQHASVTRGTWQCGFCKKKFRTREYLDLHFERKHEDDVDPAAHDCFSDLCPMLGCDETTGDDMDASALQFMCEATLGKCFPRRAGPASQRVRDTLTKALCRKQAQQVKTSTLQWVLLVMAVCFALLFIVIVWTNARDTPSTRDLRHIRHRGGAQHHRPSVWQRWFGHKPKAHRF